MEEGGVLMNKIKRKVRILRIKGVLVVVMLLVWLQKLWWRRRSRKWKMLLRRSELLRWTLKGDWW